MMALIAILGMLFIISFFAAVATGKSEWVALWIFSGIILLVVGFMYV